MDKKIPEKVVSRLTLYHSIVSEYIEKQKETITSPQIAKLLNIDDSQVRKDFKLLNNAGRCRVGYDTKEIKETIETLLRFDKNKDAFIIGAGNLGLALAKYPNFNSYGLNILALFDNDPLKVDMQIADKKIFHLTKLPDLAHRLNVEIAVLTVPKQYAQTVADFLVASNIKYIWNFTPCILETPKNVKVWNESLMASFLQFAFKEIE
ncbi:MAG: redox-sensing transcriptional repressor Rex [Candidatus Gastranaerophilales bacterium]|nr:redox-sensing transcriptional repressor Rex [Candidatus Gastranaerophilales bacterium]